MLVPVLCFTCGCPVGDVEDLFHQMRAARVRAILAERGTTATQAAVDGGLQIDCSDILDKLGIKKENYCCRKVLATAMVFTDYY
jgi:DNA-directed RNA polymerase subunit N (RpoN/RPB10)